MTLVCFRLCAFGHYPSWQFYVIIEGQAHWRVIGSDVIKTAHMILTWLLFALIGPCTCHSHRRNQSGSFVLFNVVTRTRRQSVLSKMSATSVFPMCVRASRGLLRLRSAVPSASSTTVVDILRTLSTDTPPAGSGSATGGLAQAILQERLQQQQQPSQVRRLLCQCA